MNYKVNWDGGVFAVPDAAAECLKLVTNKAAKVLLYFLRYRCFPADPTEIGEGFTAEDIEDAINCWVQAGVLFRDENEPAAIRTAPVAQHAAQVKILAEPPSIPEKNEVRAETTIRPKQHKSLLPTEISDRINESEEIAFLFRSAEGSLKRVLSFDDQRTMLWFYDHLGLKADIITMLIAFCCSMGHDNMAYIEKVAIDWNNKNIATHEQAENEILIMQKKLSFEGKVQSRLKLPNKLTASQKKYIGEWAMWDMDMDMIELAYDKTVDSTGKPAFGYMNRILQKWHDNGITDAAEAAAFDDRTKPGQKAKANDSANKNSGASAPSFDLSAILEHAKNSTPTV